MSDQSDQELLQAWQANDQESYAVLVARYHGLVRTACVRQASSSDVDDCVQAVFLVMARRPAAAARAPALAAWLLKVTWYVCQRANRAGWRRRQAERAAVANQTRSGNAGSEALAHLDDCLQRLPEKQRAAVSLHYLSGKSPEEIAQTLGTSRDNAYKLVTRGIAGLKGLFARRGMSVSAAVIASLLAAEGSAATTTATASVTATMTATASVKVAHLASGAASAMTTAILAPIIAAAGVVAAAGLVTWSMVTAPVVSVPATAMVEPIIIYSQANLPSAPVLDDMPLRSSVSQHGITWMFKNPVRVGRFVTGDWYIVGEATIVAMTPKPLFGDEVRDILHIPERVTEGVDYPHQQARHGSMVNPRPSRGTCGFDSRITGKRYDPKLFAQLPIHLTPGDSLVSTISRSSAECTRAGEGVVEPIQVAAVLTCADKPFPADAFRPSYCMGASSRVHLARELRRDLLPRLARSGQNQPHDLSAYAAKFAKSWLDIADYGFAAPIENNPRQGQIMAATCGEAALLLSSDYPAVDKERLLVGLVQVGIDFYGLARGGAQWAAHGGASSGRKFPIVFAGHMLGDEDMRHPGASLPSTRFGEDDQTAFGPISYRGEIYERSWSGSRVIFMGHSSDPSDSLEAQERAWLDGTGIVDVYPPAEWPRFGLSAKDVGSEAFRSYIASGYWVSQALAMRVLALESAWDHDAFFAYVDRWMSEDDTPLHEQIRLHNLAYANRARYGEFGRLGYVYGPTWVRDMWRNVREHLPTRRDGSQPPSAQTTWR
ncbi:MAG: sigma-70 family RNA polymerase sigma factor [Planctomycetota bacterium]